MKYIILLYKNIISKNLKNHNNKKLFDSMKIIYN